MTGTKYTKQTAPKLLPADPFHQKLAIELSVTIMRGWALSDSEQFTLTGLKDAYTFQLWQQRVFTELSKETYLRLACVIDVNRQLLQPSGGSSRTIPLFRIKVRSIICSAMAWKAFKM